MSALPVFALRLAAGMVACLLLLSPALVNPRFYRVHFLVALGLTTVAGVCEYGTAGWLLWTLLGAAGLFALAGSCAWALEGAPGGRTLIVLAALALGGALACVEAATAAPGESLARVALVALTSAGVLGSALTAMLMGHSYLIAPAMSLKPLLRLIAALAVSTAARMAVDGVGLCWTSGAAVGTLDNERLLLLLVRWAVGFAGALGLTWMAWRTARIRSTQSATGILYVVVVFCFLGELTSRLLQEKGFVA
jgi:hypothetical protein